MSTLGHKQNMKNDTRTKPHTAVGWRGGDDKSETLHPTFASSFLFYRLLVPPYPKRRKIKSTLAFQNPGKLLLKLHTSYTLLVRKQESRL